ncbi:acetyl-CoA hydrolase/transferase C-terminal domain-containing protein [Mucilaginibacter antarcticus]|uniref:acetyl-CoA hydrolase/transferase C-terminal domain-containing protein n=1 Tax=Mucilaginibacter antarcticus TaxID=1855725 RepID=UPI003640047D
MVDLFGKSLKQRAQALIEIAHPNHREMLENSFLEGLRKHKYKTNNHENFSFPHRFFRECNACFRLWLFPG